VNVVTTEQQEAPVSVAEPPPWEGDVPTRQREQELLWQAYAATPPWEGEMPPQQVQEPPWQAYVDVATPPGRAQAPGETPQQQVQGPGVVPPQQAQAHVEVPAQQARAPVEVPPQPAQEPTAVPPGSPHLDSLWGDWDDVPELVKAPLGGPAEALRVIDEWSAEAWALQAMDTHSRLNRMRAQMDAGAIEYAFALVDSQPSHGILAIALVRSNWVGGKGKQQEAVAIDEIVAGPAADEPTQLMSELANEIFGWAWTSGRYALRPTDQKLRDRYGRAGFGAGDFQGELTDFQGNPLLHAEVPPRSDHALKTLFRRRAPAGRR